MRCERSTATRRVLSTAERRQRAVPTNAAPRVEALAAAARRPQRALFAAGLAQARFGVRAAGAAAAAVAHAGEPQQLRRDAGVRATLVPLTLAASTGWNAAAPAASPATKMQRNMSLAPRGMDDCLSGAQGCPSELNKPQQRANLTD